jgi:flagellar P-ring protein precursor FlgI
MKSALRIILVFLLVTAGSVSGQVRLKDIARLEGAGPTSLIGYGLVVGLNGTGDRHTSSFTEQSVANMLDRFGITVSQHDLRLRNVAAVMVTAQISPYVRPGSTFDVGVSSIGDASSLAGGALLPTPLSDLDGGVWGHAQGSVSVGGFNIEAGRVAVRKNYTLVGRVPGGGLAERGDSVQFARLHHRATRRRSVERPVRFRHGQSPGRRQRGGHSADRVRQPGAGAIHLPG